MLVLPPRTSWLYRISISLSVAQRYLITLLFIAVFVFVWFWFLHQPMNNRIDTIQNYVACTKIPSDIQEKVEILRKDMAISNNSATSADSIPVILEYVEQAGLVFEHAAVDNNTLHIQASGTYKHIMSFFNQISTLPVLACDVRITQGADDNTFSLSAMIEPLQ